MVRYYAPMSFASTAAYLARQAAAAGARAAGGALVGRMLIPRRNMARGFMRRPRSFGAMGKRTVGRTRGFWDPRTQQSDWVTNQKILDPVVSTSYNVTTSASIILLNGIAAGDDSDQRDGRRVTLDSVSIRGDLFYAVTTSAHPADMVRMMLVYDKQANGAAPAITDILINANADSHYNQNNMGRFEVLWDQVWTLPQVPASTTSSVLFPKIKATKRVGRATQYSGTGNTVASIASGALYLVWVGSQASGANNTVAELSVRTMFHG